MSREIESLSLPIEYVSARVDSLGQIKGYELAREPVNPLTAQSIRNMLPQERAKYTEGVVIPYSSPDLNRIFRYPLSEIRPETLQLAATALSLKNTQWELGYFQGKRARNKELYEAEKSDIRAGKRGGSKIAKKVDQAVKIWKGQDLALEDQMLAQEAIKSSLLDQFIQRTFLTPGGTEKFLKANADLASQTNELDQDMNSLLAQAKARLTETRFSESGELFKYKPGLHNLITEEDSASLREVVNKAFDESDPKSSKNLLLKDISLGILEYYWKNIDRLFGPGEKAPRIAYFRDLVFSALMTEDINLVDNTIRFIWEKLAKDSQQARKEYIDIHEKGYNERYQAIIDFGADLQQYDYDSGPLGLLSHFSPDMVQKWDPNLRGGFVGKYYNMVHDFECVNRYSNKVLGLRDYSSKWETERPDYGMDNLRFGLDKFYFIRTLSMILSIQYSLSEISVLLENYSDKNTFITLQKTLGISFGLEEGDIRTFLEDLRGSDPVIDNHLRSYVFLKHAFFGQEIGDKTQLDRFAQGNKELLKKIYDENLWFVSPWGDRFSASKNLDLRDKHIKDLTFYPEPDIRGHRVKITFDWCDLEDKPISLTYLFHSDGNVLSEQGRPIGLLRWVDLSFKRFLLERLHYITSGVLGDRDAKSAETENEAVNPDMIRRPHWRTLQSTQDRIYTLTSNSARRHAGYVLSIYGIDIYDENLRRRVAGTLAQNNCITFVKEVEKEDKEPNELIYNPNLIFQY